VFPADFYHARMVVDGGHDDSARTLDRLGDETSDIFRPEGEDFRLELRDQELGKFRFRGSFLAAIETRRTQVMDEAGFRLPVRRIATVAQRGREVGAAVIGLVPRDDVLAGRFAA